MSQLAPKINLNNGMKMPILGLGTYLAKAGECEEAVMNAIDIGYRHIDTAFFYQNEKEVGNAIRAKIAEGVVTRDDLFVTTKIWNTFHDPENVAKACKLSYDNLGIGSIDLFLIHWPMGYKFIGWDVQHLLPKNANGNLLFSDVDYINTWKSLENCVKSGLVKSIGVSNFNSEQIQRIMDIAEIKPVTNQVECNPNINQKELIKFCKDFEIVITSYSPIGRPQHAANDPTLPQPALYHENVKKIGDKYNKTAAQVTIRYLIDIGTVPIPKSSNKLRIAENFDVFDFQLSENEITEMDQLNTNRRVVPFLLCEKHKFYPFNIKF